MSETLRQTTLLKVSGMKEKHQQKNPKQFHFLRALIGNH